MKRKIPLALAAAALLIAFSTVFLPEPERGWSHETVAEDSDRFVDLELDEEDMYIMYRSAEGLELLNKGRGFLASLNDGWNRENVEEGNTGSYLDLELSQDGLSAVYQRPEVGNASLVYAEKEEDWRKEVVDSASGSGLGAGMYAALTSYRNSPLVFYHVEQGDRMYYALKQGESWKREQIGEDTGWHTSADSCGEKTFVFYRNVNNRALKLGSFDGSFSSEDVNGTTNGMTDIEARDCNPILAYQDYDEGDIYYIDEEKESVAEGKLSRVSMAGERLAFNRKGDGLFYSERTEDGWNTTSLDTSPAAGRYVDIEYDGKPRIAYTRGSELVYATQKDEIDLKKWFYGASAVLLLAAALILALSKAGVSVVSGRLMDR